MNDPAFLPVHELAPLLQRRELSPLELTKAVIERIERLEPRLNCFITFKPEEALEQARRAEEEIARGEYRGSFHGVPLAIKDNIAVAGWPTTNGSSLMAEHITDYDATVVEKLRAAGAIIVGKNNMHEWAMGVACTNGWFGAVHNPWDEKRVPGGSSGGSAAAVSASLVYGSVGTDFKGSVRIPGSLCGVVGFKPTQGLVSRFGQLPPTSSNFDHLGPIVKDVADAALMLNVIAGHDPRDPTSVAFPGRDFAAELDRGMAGLRVGVPSNFFFQRASEEVGAVVKAAIGKLAELGAEVREVSIPSLEHMSLLDTGYWTELTTFLLPYLRRGPEAFADRSIWERTIVDQLVRTVDTMKTAQLRNLIRAELRRTMEQVDLLAAPTTPTTAFEIGTEDRLAAAKPTRNQSPITVLTLPFNVTGFPAISVPCGFDAQSLPVGLMLAGRPGEDGLVLRAARAYEQAAGGYRVPPMAQEA